MKIRNRFWAGLLSAAMFITSAGLFPAELTTQAAAADYPVQYFRLALGDTDNNVNADGSRLAPAVQNGTSAEKWSLNWVSDGVYEIVSAATGQILTASGNGVSLAQDTDAANQRWRIEGVQKDFEGFTLYYKVTSNADSSKALTFREGVGFSLAAYSGDTYQKFKLNLDGCEGYAANAKVSGGEKACTIGGLLGKTVYATTVKDMIAYMKSEEPLTIVIAANLDFKDWSKADQKIEDNKTIVGSYAAHDVYDLQWRSDDLNGNANIKPSNNIVLRNFSVTSRTLRGVVMIQIYCSRNVWFDHISFNNTISYDRTGNGLDEVGKFIWINSPSMGWRDEVYNGISPDYITLSYLKLQNRYWTVAYGTQNGETTRCRTSVMYCDWEKCVRRTPQIGNGTGHFYNNYHEGYGDGSNGSGTSQIIGGDASDILSEYNRFQGFSQRQALEIGYHDQPARDVGSQLSTSTNGTPSAVNLTPKKTSSFDPSKIYGYELINSYAANGYDVQKFCKTYSGAFNSASGLKYITDADMDGWIMKKYDCPFLRHVELTVQEGAVLDTAFSYTFRNVNSGLYLSAADGTLTNGSNVGQGKPADKLRYTWNLKDAGDGYYYIYSAADDRLCIDLPYGNAQNGTSLGLWTNDESDARKFKFLDNGDNTYTIVTKCSHDQSCFGVIADSKDDGADVIQWTSTGNTSQKWELQAKLEPLNGTLITELDRLDTEHAGAWAIAQGLGVGSPMFGDREDVTYTDIPEALLGAEYLILPCDAKYVERELAECKAGADMTVYVALDNRVVSLPAWLANWTKTELTVSNNKDVTFALYQKEVRTGETVVLGTNGQSAGCVNYTVMAVPAASEPETTEPTTTTTEPTQEYIMGDVNNDGSFEVADVVALQRWLLAVPGTELKNWEAADFCKDGRLNVFDLCLMKRALLEKTQ